MPALLHVHEGSRYSTGQLDGLPESLEQNLKWFAACQRASQRHTSRQKKAALTTWGKLSMNSPELSCMAGNRLTRHLIATS